MKMEDMVLVSVDDHVVEPRDAFIKHYPAGKKDRAPQIVTNDKGQNFWVWAGQRYPAIGLNAVVGRPRSEYGMEPSAYEQMRPGCYTAKDRVDDMNVNGVAASLNFPTFPSFAGGVFLQKPEKDDALLAVRAYNDWHIQDWCGEAPGRLIPLACLPLWDMNETLAEIKRMSDAGVRNITFPDNPSLIGLPSIHNEYWEPFWKAITDHEMLIHCHIGTGARAAHASDESPIDAWITTMPMSIANSAADWLFATFWDRYPKLKMALSEGGVGWIPYFLERADFTYEHHHEWTFTDFGKEKPSDRFHRHIITCFLDDVFGMDNLKYMNVDHVTWECDYPHSDTLWPNCPEYLWRSVDKLPAEVIDKVTHENALRELRFDLFGPMGGKENCTVGALRALATHVDVSPRVGLGGLNAEEQRDVVGKTRKPITSGEIQAMFANA